MTNQKWLCSLSAEDFLCHIKWLLQNYGKRWTDSDSAIIEWLQGKHEINSEDKGMTNDEAIKTLKGYLWICCAEKWNEALDMAIKALEQEPGYTSQIAQKAYEDGKKDGYVQAKLEQEPFINKPRVSSGVCEHDENVVLDKIRAEIESCREDEEPYLCDYRYHRNEGLEMALDIIDKYKTKIKSEGKE